MSYKMRQKNRSRSVTSFTHLCTQNQLIQAYAKSSINEMNILTYKLPSTTYLTWMASRFTVGSRIDTIIQCGNHGRWMSERNETEISRRIQRMERKRKLNRMTKERADSERTFERSSTVYCWVQMFLAAETYINVKARKNSFIKTVLYPLSVDMPMAGNYR